MLDKSGSEPIDAGLAAGFGPPDDETRNSAAGIGVSTRLGDFEILKELGYQRSA